jgi:basic amino acid/polyamine antiporter, APA family
MNQIFKILENSDFRCFALKKPNPQSEPPRQVFSFFHLLVILLRSLLGVGIFSLHGDISKSVAGPAIVYSYVIIAITMLLAGLNLAEFCSHSNASGSTYLQTYMVVGEFWAFIVGWLSILCWCLGK